MSAQQQLPPHLEPFVRPPACEWRTACAGRCVRCEKSHRRKDALGPRASFCESCALEGIEEGHEIVHEGPVRWSLTRRVGACKRVPERPRTCTRHRRAVRRRMALCPLHEDRTPSFSLYRGKDGKERWACHGCDRGGGCARPGGGALGRNVSDLSRDDGGRGSRVPERRGLTTEIADAAKLRPGTHESEGSVEIPWFDAEGKEVYITGRSLNGTETSTDTARVPVPRCTRHRRMESARVAVVEGQIDTLAPRRRGRQRSLVRAHSRRRGSRSSVTRMKSFSPSMQTSRQQAHQEGREALAGKVALPRGHLARGLQGRWRRRRACGRTWWRSYRNGGRDHACRRSGRSRGVLRGPDHATDVRVARARGKRRASRGRSWCGGRGSELGRTCRATVTDLHTPNRPSRRTR